MLQKKNHQMEFALYGIFIGLIFPLTGTLISCYLKFGYIDFLHCWQLQKENSLLWIIDTAPFFLGTLAAFAGRQMDKVQEKNRELNEKYLQMNVLRQMADTANKAKSEFLATMSHEIRTPLSAIMGYNNLLKGSRLDDEQANLVDTIGIAADNLFVTINDVLDASRLEAGMLVLEKKAFSMYELVQNLIRIFNDRAISKGLKLILHFDHSIPAFLEGDSTRLSQILINLLGNAIKFTEKGSIELKVTELAKSDSEAEILFVVKDSGIGIKKENLNRIFERFTQEEASTNRIYGGTGLGLHIVKFLLDLFNGKIQVRSTPGEGSEFSFQISFPFAIGMEDLEVGGISSATEERPIEGMRVLLVEDNEFNLFLAETYLRRNGVLLSKAGNGREAIEQAQAQKFDSILMDIQMPVMDGKEATRMLRKQGNQVPVIGCSAHALPSEKAECLALGMNAYITKPYEEQELVKVLKSFSIKTGNSKMHTQGDDIHEILGKIRADVGPDFVSIIVQKFNTDIPELIQDLEKHLKDHDFSLIQEKTHRLAGTMATFRFPEGLRLARVAEYAARDRKELETKEGIHELLGYLRDTLGKLASFIK